VTESLNKEKTKEIVDVHYELSDILFEMSDGKLGKLIPIGRLDA
jgi:hypothetical protein